MSDSPQARPPEPRPEGTPAIQTGVVSGSASSKHADFEYMTPSVMKFLWYVVLIAFAVVMGIQTLTFAFACLTSLLAEAPGGILFFGSIYVATMVFELLLLIGVRVALETCHVQFDMAKSLRQLAGR